VRRFMLSAMVLGLMLGATRADDDPEPPAKDVGKLVGEWELSEIKVKGVAVPFPKDALQMSFKFEKNGTLSMDGQGQQKVGKWKANAKKTPRELELDDGNMKTEAIYKLDKDVLTIGASQAGGRPKDFDSAEATLVFKRKKK
jgi:uncharacterized protein (TIGR03067 family)